MTIRHSLLIVIALLFPFMILSQIVANDAVKNATNKLDSVPGIISSKVNDAKQSTKNTLVDGIGSMKEKYLSGTIKDVKKEAEQLFHSPLRINNASLIYLSSFDTSLLGASSVYYRHDISFSGDMLLFGIPLTTLFVQRNYTDAFNFNQNVFSMRFDKDGYLQSLKNRMAGRFDPKSMIEDIQNSIDDIKNKAITNLKAELHSINTGTKGLVDKEMQAMLNRKDLFAQDMSSLRHTFFNTTTIAQEEGDQALLTFLLHKINSGEIVDSSQLINVQSAVHKQQALHLLLDKVEQYRSKWNSSGLLKQIRTLELLQKSNLQKLASDPSFIRSQAKKHLSLKGLQKFFLNINRFNIGQDALTTSPVSFQHFLHSGVSTEFLNTKGNSLLLVLGKQKDFNSLFDYRFAQTLVSNAGQVAGGRFALKKSGTTRSEVSVANFNQAMQGGNNSVLPFIGNNFRQILVTTLSNEIKVGEKGSIHLDLSRSATSYKNNSAGSDSALKPQNNLSQVLNGQNIWDNTAFAFSYSDEIKDKGLNYRLNFSKTANGYTNPGNSFLTGGSLEGGGQVRKTFLKEKMQASLRGNLRHYKFGEQTLYRWMNLYWVADIKWKFSKGQYVSLRYQPNRMLRISKDERQMINFSDRITGDLNIARRIGKISYRNFLSLVYQDTRFVVSANEHISAKSMQVNSFQNFLLRKGTVSVNASYTYSDNSSRYVYFNSSLNADAGYNYVLFKKLFLFTGIVYSHAEDWYSQLGVRQSVSGEVNEHFNVSIYIDARKNLSLLQPLWNSPVRGDISITYLFKTRK